MNYNYFQNLAQTYKNNNQQTVCKAPSNHRQAECYYIYPNDVFLTRATVHARLPHDKLKFYIHEIGIEKVELFNGNMVG